MDELDLLRRKLERERRARSEAEALLEQKSREVYHANEELRNLAASLEQRVAERTAELRSSEARLGTIINLTGDGIIAIDADQHIRLFSASAERIFGYAAAEVLGKPLSVLMPDASRQVTPGSWPTSPPVAPLGVAWVSFARWSVVGKTARSFRWRPPSADSKKQVSSY